MAGHNKWSSIKHKKGAADKKRGKIFSRISKEITLAVKLGGADQDSNPRLRLAITNAKSQNMPNDNISRAIKKGTGEIESENLEELFYEGYGPEGIALVVECLSDNRNRTAADIKAIFNKNNGSFGATGSVSWMFHKYSQFIVEQENIDENFLLETTLDAGAEEIKILDENTAEILGSVESFEDIQQALEKENITIINSQLAKIPENTVSVTEAKILKQILRLIDTLEDNEDVQNVYSNFDADDNLLEQVENL